MILLLGVVEGWDGPMETSSLREFNEVEEHALQE